MGWFHSSKNFRKVKNEAQIKRIESALFVKILKFDLNMGANPQLTIESRFTRENTNDMGEGLLPQTAHVIIMEFKKFMYLVATEILKKRREGQLDLNKNFKVNKQWFFDSPYAAPPYIERVWRLLILYNKNYEQFWDKICGGFIEKADPREDIHQNFIKYLDCLKSLDVKKDFVKPFHNLWPRYNNPDEYSTDLEYNCYVSSEGIPQVVQYMNRHWVEAGNSQIQTATCK